MAGWVLQPGNPPRELQGRTGLQGPSSCLKPLVPLPLELFGWVRLVSLAWGRAGGGWLFPVSTPEEASPGLKLTSVCLGSLLVGSLFLGWVPFLFTPAPCCLLSSEGLEALVGYREKGRFRKEGRS